MAIEVTKNLTQVTISSAGVAGANGTSGTSVVSQDLSHLATTASFNSFTSSNDSVIVRVLQTTASLNLKTGSFVTTGSNTFNGNQTISGSLNVSASIILPNHASAPSSTNSGALYFNTTDYHFYGWNGGQWKQLDN